MNQNFKDSSFVRWFKNAPTIIRLKKAENNRKLERDWENQIIAIKLQKKQIND